MRVKSALDSMKATKLRKSQKRLPILNSQNRVRVFWWRPGSYVVKHESMYMPRGLSSPSIVKAGSKIRKLYSQKKQLPSGIN